MSQITETNKKKRSGFRRFATTLFIVIVLVLAGLIYWKYYFTYSQGNRTGLLQKFTYKGNIFKTYEGELVLSSIRSQGNMTIASEKFLFSVTNETVAKKLENLQGQFVTVHYEMKNGTLPWRGENRYLVDSIRVAAEHQQLP